MKNEEVCQALKALNELAEEAHGNGNSWVDVIQPRLDLIKPYITVCCLTDDEVLEAMRPHIYEADGGYVWDTAKVEVLAAGRALLACARQKAEEGK